MEKINSNEYVRTMDGKIGTFVRYSSRKDDSLYKSPANCFIRLNNRKSDLQCFRDYILKHSPNIIDLIEEGDYVNGEKVDTVFRDGIIYYDRLRIHTTEYNDIFEEDIKEILTKEQYEANCYKVKEEI